MNACIESCRRGGVYDVGDCLIPSRQFSTDELRPSDSLKPEQIYLSGLSVHFLSPRRCSLRLPDQFAKF